MAICSVPFCPKRRSGEGEWICADHWKMTGRAARHAYEVRRKAYNDGDENMLRHVAAMWDILKRQAIERAVGIG